MAEQFTCASCSQHFTKKFNLQRHAAQYHGQEKELKFTMCCPGIIMRIHCITVDTKPVTIKNVISMQKSKCHLELGSFKNEIRKDVSVFSSSLHVRIEEQQYKLTTVQLYKVLAVLTTLKLPSFLQKSYGHSYACLNLFIRLCFQLLHVPQVS